VSDLLLVIRSYVVLQLLAVAGWPWLLVLLRVHTARDPLQPQRLPPLDLAMSLAKSSGIVLVSYATWLLGFAGAPTVGAVAWLVWAAFAITGFLVLRLRWRDIVELLHPHRRAILIGEAVFLAVFLSLCRVRALTPDATFCYDEQKRSYDESASEKFTNFALLASLYREHHLPPRDTWFDGYPINYYYFGHFEWATFCNLAGISPRVGFNIGQAAVFALIAANAFSLALLLTRRIAAGLLAAYAVPLMGSPYGCLQLLLEGLKHFRFWEASRIVEGTIVNGQVAGPITEFPFFTFVVGDFHAHGISFHSFLLALAIAFLVPLGALGNRGPTGWWRRTGLEAVLLAVPLGLLVAVTAMTNAWDAPSLGLAIAAILVLRSLWLGGLRLRGILRPLVLSALAAAVAVVFLLPHLTTFQFPVGAKRDPNAFYLIGPVKWLGGTHLSEFKDYMVHFGFLLIPLTLAIHARLIGHVRRGEETKRSRYQALLGASYLVALYIFLFAQRYFLLFFLAAMIGYALVLAVVELRVARGRNEDAGGRDGQVFAAAGVLSAIALLLSLFAEVWVVDDGYEGAFERYNTVFKTYNIAWLLYGVSCAAVIATVLSWCRTGWQPVARIDEGGQLVGGNSASGKSKSGTGCQPVLLWAGIAVVLAMGFAYPFAATLARVDETRRRAPARERIALPPGPELDAVRYYASVNRDEYRLIEWIADTIRGKPAVAEGCRALDSYTVQSRIATFTGLCTVLAWPQHEGNWRSRVRSSLNRGEIVDIWGEMNRRIADLETLFTTRDDALIREIIGRYQIEYIVIGRWERALYGGAAGQHLRELFKPAFESGDTIFLKTQR